MKPEDELDVLAIQRDADLLDALAARAELPPHAEDDPIAGLLAALAADVDEGLPPVGTFSTASVAATGTVHIAANPVRPLRAARRGPRTVVGLGVVGAILSAGGVAAAVTGDPLAPIKPFAKAVTALTEPSKPTEEKVQDQLEEASEALATGDPQTAMEKLEKARKEAAKLSGPQAATAMKQVEELERLIRSTAAPGLTPGPGSPGAGVPSPGPTAVDEPEDEQRERDLAEEERRKEREEKQRLKEEERKKKQEEKEKKQDAKEEQKNQKKEQGGRQTTTPTPTPTPTPQSTPSIQTFFTPSQDTADASGDSPAASP